MDCILLSRRVCNGNTHWGDAIRLSLFFLSKCSPLICFLYRLSFFSYIVKEVSFIPLRLLFPESVFPPPPFFLCVHFLSQSLVNARLSLLSLVFLYDNFFFFFSVNYPSPATTIFISFFTSVLPFIVHFPPFFLNIHFSCSFPAFSSFLYSLYSSLFRRRFISCDSSLMVLSFSLVIFFFLFFSL